MNQTINHPNEKPAQLMWTVFILMFFMIQAVIWTVAISITARDTSHAVVSRYEEQALQWDDVKRTRQASADLGWRTELVVDDRADIRSNRELVVFLFDQLNQPIKDATVQLDAFHRGTAAHVQRLSLSHRNDGQYVANVRIDKPGKWCFAGEAKVGDQRRLIDTVLTLDPVGNN